MRPSRHLGLCELSVCRHAGLAAGQPGATGDWGSTRGAAASNAPAGWGGLVCGHMHAAVVGPASSMADGLWRGDVIPVPTPGAVQRRRQLELLQVHHAVKSTSVEWPVEAPLPRLRALLSQNVKVQCPLLTVPLVPPTPLPLCALLALRLQRRWRGRGRGCGSGTGRSCSCTLSPPYTTGTARWPGCTPAPPSAWAAWGTPTSPSPCGTSVRASSGWTTC